jgi:rare lipoprotein A
MLAKISAVGLPAALLIGSGASVGETPTDVSDIRPMTPPEVTQVATPLETGFASFYAAKYHGRLTASGEVFDMRALTAAHPRLAFGTRVKVIHAANGRSVIVRINDRGPFLPNRVIDLSLAAAEELGMVQAGLAQVRLEQVK